jgi:predicted permease
MHRAFAIGAIVTLALGIAATTALFSVIYGVLLRPLPFPESHRLVRLSEFHTGATAPFRGAWLSNQTYFAWMEQARTIGPIAIFGDGTYTVGELSPQRLAGASASPELFDVLQVPPALGRLFTRDDARPGAAPVVVLSDSLWRERFGGSADALGQTMLIDRQSRTIIGVTPAGFAFPTHDVRLYIPDAMPLPGSPNQPRLSITRAVARLAPGATIEQAAAEGTAAAQRDPRPFVAELMFGKGGPVQVRVEGIVEQMTRRIRPALLALGAAVVVLLLIACANVANLFLSRGVARERELAVRVAIGASRGAIIRQLLAESFVMAGAGGVAGIAGAWAVLQSLPLIAPEDLPRLSDVQLDGVALAFAVAMVAVSAVLSGLMPALRAARPDLLPALRESAGASTSARTVRARQAMLVAESALAVILLIGAGLLIRSFDRLISVDPGYDAANVLTADVYLPGAESGQADTSAFIAEFLPRMRALPGVAAAGVANMTPLGGMTAIAAFTVAVPGRTPVSARALAYSVSPGYAEALRLRLRAGRLLEEQDSTAAIQSLVVNEEFVRTFLDGADAIGLQFPSIMANGGMAEIVGVVGNVLKEGLDTQPQPEVYIALSPRQRLRGQISVVLRSDGDSRALAPLLRQLLFELRPDAALDQVSTMASRIDVSVAQPRFAAWVLAVFAALAMVLSAVGLYSVLAYTVARRRRELGVRSALGASRFAIVSLVCRDGLIVAGLGLVIGMITAAAMGRWLQSLLFGIDARDPVTFAAAPLVLLAVALVASLIPAVRAAGTDATVVLRSE